jgi:hypothetical protein
LAAAAAVGLVIMVLDAVGIRIAHSAPRVGMALFVAGTLLISVVAAIKTFFFSREPRRERWLEYYRQSIVPFRAFEDLIASRRRRR